MSDSPSRRFHIASKNLLSTSGAELLPESEWAKEWLITYYKSYPRFPQVPLSEPGTPPTSLFEAVRARASKREFVSAPDEQEVSTIFWCMAGVTSNLSDGRKRRSYPSAGARYPIETYALLREPVGKIAPGLYHFAPRNHAFTALPFRIFPNEKLVRQAWAVHAPLLVFLTSRFERNLMKYGERGYRHVLLEAGHMSQNAYLAAASLGLACSALSATNDDVIENMLQIDGISESLVHTLALGR